MRRALIALLLAAAFVQAAPARAADKKDDPPSPTVLMLPVALPVIVDGRLVNYVFVSLRLGLAPGGDIPRLRAKEPYFRDALLHFAYRNSLVRDDNYAALDEDRLKAATLRSAADVVGPGKVISVQVIKQAPQRVQGLPKPKAAPQTH